MLSKYVTLYMFYIILCYWLFVFLHIQHFMRPWQRILNSLLFAVSIKNKFNYHSGRHLVTRLTVVLNNIVLRLIALQPNPMPLSCLPSQWHSEKKRLKAHRAPITEVRYVTCHMGSQCYGATRHKWTRFRSNPNPQAGTRFTYPGGIEGWVDRDGWLHTETVYLLTDSHPSKY